MTLVNPGEWMFTAAHPTTYAGDISFDDTDTVATTVYAIGEDSKVLLSLEVFVLVIHLLIIISMVI